MEQVAPQFSNNFRNRHVRILLAGV